MKAERYLECLADDYGRLREVVAGRPGAPVPTCPEWTVAELVRHVADVYQDKVLAMRTGAEQPWPPEQPTAEPLALLDRSYAQLRAEFAARPAEAATGTWYEPDQTVGFWIRRMAQETVIHRVDAELAVGAPVRDIPADLAIDGIDEVLTAFLAYATRTWPKAFTGLLPTTGRRVLLDTGRESWLVRIDSTGVRVGLDPATPANASVFGTPAELLLWLWRRSAETAVRWDGDPAAVQLLRRVLEPATR